MSAIVPYTDDEIRQLKIAFAREWLKTDDPSQAAFNLIKDVGLAMQAAYLWVNDQIVCDEKRRIISDGELKTILPSKEAQAREVWKMATDPTVDEENRLKAHRLYAEIMGNIAKDEKNYNQTNIIAQNVMLVKDHGSDDEWQQAAIEQQRTLIGNA